MTQGRNDPPKTAGPSEAPPPSDGDAPASGRLSRERLMPPQRRFFRALPGKKARVDLGRRLLAPLVVALVPLFWVLDASHRAAISTLGRDQGIFQYIAWAVRGGSVDYRDVRDVNGPLIHMIHMLGLALGGADEHRFHVLDLGATAIAFAFCGACIPSLVSASASRGGSRFVAWAERAAWAGAAAVVLSGQYQLYLYWNQGQRESFCDWFLFPSLALMLVPARPHAGGASAARRVVLIAALSTITWFGKPSFVVFTAAQLVALLWDDALPLARRARVGWFVAGGVLGAVPPLLYLLRFGDLGAFLRLSFVEVPQVYRFIWAKSAQEIFGEDGPLTVAATGLACAALLFGLVATRALPRRAVVLPLALLAGLANVLLQHKGFGYHFHPLTAATQLGFLVVCAMLAARFRNARRGETGRWLALAASAAFAFYVAYAFRGSAQTKNVWILAGGETPEKRAEREWFDSFKSYDFFPWELREAASYLGDKTDADARVQIYGMDPYLLFLAHRRSATPYIYAYDLTADAALDGGWSNRPDDAQKERILELRAAHERDLLARLKAAPPEAFVFIDHSPLVSYPDSWEDFRHTCKEAAVWVATNYHPARSFGGEVHVWMRDDLPNTDHEKGLE